MGKSLKTADSVILDFVRNNPGYNVTIYSAHGEMRIKVRRGSAQWTIAGHEMLATALQLDHAAYLETVFESMKRNIEKALREGGSLPKSTKTLLEWARIDGVQIIDPDGFDRSDPELYDRQFTRAEYDEGILRCSLVYDMAGNVKG